MHVVTGEEFYFKGQTTPSPCASFPAIRWPTGETVDPQGDNPGPEKAEVMVNHSRWIVCCPFCPSAQYAFESDRRFFCAECLNFQVGRRFIPVAWPAGPTRARIEELLLARPDLSTRNWLPGETVADLARENEERGWPT